MLEPEFDETPNNPYRLSQRLGSSANGSTARSRLVNLAADIRKDYKSAVFGTSRMIRIYQNTGKEIELLERVDWELPPLHVDAGEPFCLTRESSLEHLAAAIGNEEFTAVVLKDLGKGVVCDAVVEWLSRKFPDIPWYVSTKNWMPARLLDKLNSVNLRLFLIPQVAAQTAIRNGELSRWIVQSSPSSLAVPSAEAHRLMKAIQDRCGRVGTVVAALPRGLDIVAMEHSSGDSYAGLVGSKLEDSGTAVEVAMASVFMPTLAALSLAKREISFVDLIQRSAAFTHKWMQTAAKRIMPGDDISLIDECVCVDEAAASDSLLRAGWNKLASWDAAGRDWDTSMSRDDVCVVREGGTPRIELWRSMIEVPGYVCCVDSKRSVLRRLMTELGRFVEGNSAAQLSVLITAPPGSGKTRLIGGLAAANNMRLVEFNITQMTSRDDLLSCFDKIVTTQAEHRTRRVLVFVDEINAGLEGNHVYDAFLAPLEEGSYVRADKKFRIGPCAWIFAGTETPSTSVAGELRKQEKASDFESRLTVGHLDLTPTEDTSAEDKAIAVERVYLGVAILKGEFPDVREVSTKVLELFAKLPRRFAVRELRNLVRAFVDVQYGKVHGGNVPIDKLATIQKSAREQKDYEFDRGAWQKLRDDEYVTIVG